MDLFIPIRFRTSVQLAPSELHSEFKTILLRKLKINLEGVCSRFGYIRPGSIEILRRSVGQFVKQHFNGHIRFDMICKAEVCNPPQGTILKAVVRNKNAMGLLAESTISMDGKDVPVLDVIIPKRAAGISSELDLETIEIGQEIYIAVQGKRYQLNDKKISVIGKAVPKPEKLKALRDMSDEIVLDDNESDDLPASDVLTDEEDEVEEEVEREVENDDSEVDEPKKLVVIDDEDALLGGAAEEEQDPDFFEAGDASDFEDDVEGMEDYEPRGYDE